MFGYLMLAFIIVPVVELSLLIKVGQIIGVFNTLVIVVGTCILGAQLARHEGLKVLAKVQKDINAGSMPAESVFDGVIILISGILLLTPGIITDIIGLLGLIPATRGALKVWLKKMIRQMIDRGDVVTITSYRVNKD